MDVRTDLLRRADEFCREHRITRAALALTVVNNNKFFGRVEKGENFTLETYERFLRHFETTPAPDGERAA